MAELRADPSVWNRMLGEMVRLAEKRAPIQSWSWVLPHLNYYSANIYAPLNLHARHAFARTGGLAAALVQYVNAYEAQRKPGSS